MQNITTRETLRTFRLAAWLGWQIEGNWADPFAFLVLTILRPMATALILVVMYEVIAGGARGDFFSYLFISNAFFPNCNPRFQAAVPKLVAALAPACGGYP